MQDIHIYDLQNYYGIYPTLSYDTFQKLIRQLKQQRLLDLNDSYYFQLTAQGQKWLLNREQSCLLENFSGLKYNKLTPIFTDRLLLIVQTLANSMMGDFRFIPVVDKNAVQVWVKSFYQRIKSQTGGYRRRLYQELNSVLYTVKEQEANLFVDRLTGYKTYGMSSQQLADIYGLSVMDVPLVWTRIIHQLLETIQSNRKTYPLLYAIIEDQSGQSFITATANKTHQLLVQGYTLEKIADFRRLKINTIYDHVVEIALIDPSFSIASFVSHKQYENIVSAIEQIRNYSLKQLKEIVDPDISYFQIRLVLAMIKHK